uniref:ABC transporter ATP-binding protein n=1 Tax=uncultured Bilophila sp. TaxID=529385 RepID=UPI0025DBC840|nr:ABC transporter ATP-binding protein [uncultured Bilophila sp.]
MSMLSVENLSTRFFLKRGTVHALEDVSFTIREREVVGVVGESGCGKSLTSLSVMRLVPPPGEIVAGRILFEGENLLEKPDRDMKRVRGAKISMIFQEPMTALNPVLTVETQLLETVETHTALSRAEAREAVLDALRQVEIPNPEKRLRAYPHQLSGGQRQRIMIAMALICNPRLLIADEPTTALDVTVQAQILRLMKRLVEERGSSLLLITHDFGVIAEMAQWIVVMYGGNVVEQGPARTIFSAARHPYTQGLLRAIPYVRRSGGKRGERIYEIPGTVPILMGGSLTGCRFKDRCDRADERCRSQNPPVKACGDGHQVKCWRV